MQIYYLVMIYLTLLTLSLVQMANQIFLHKVEFILEKSTHMALTRTASTIPTFM